MSEADAISQDERFLNQLKAKNEDRRKELARIAAEYQHELGDSDGKPSSVLGALEAELKLLKQPKPETLECRSNVVVASLFDSGSNNNKSDRSSEATVDGLLMDQYAEEVLASYRGLVETQTTLQMVLERETSKLVSKKAFVEQQKSLFRSMDEKQRLQKSRLDQNNESQQFTTSQSDAASTAMENANKANEWIHQELHYVCQTLSSEKKDEAAVVSAKKKRPGLSSSRKDSRGNKNKRQRSEAKSALETLVLELTRHLLDEPHSPYLLVEDADDGSGQATARRAEQVKLLRQCGVLQSQAENENLIRLTDFRD